MKGEGEEVAGDAVMTNASAAGDAAREPGRHQGHHSRQQSGQSVHQQQQHSLQQPRHASMQQDTPPIDPAISAPTASSPSASPRPGSVPAAFPKKRRGRPPGRPNATVRDADYEQNPLVQIWNGAKIDRAVSVVTISIRDALTEQSLVHETQRAIFRLPSRETILFVQGWITAKHIASQRPSYVNGLLIHSRGQDAAVSCAQCTEKRAKNALGPFLTCRVLPGNYHNSCSNCKWFDNTSTCSLYTGPKPNRKRKAKEQLQPPPAAAGDGPRSDQPQPRPHAPPQLQPEADMTPIQADEHGQHPNMTPTTDATNDPAANSPPHTEVGSAELPEVASQPDSLADAHFVLHKSGPEADAQLADDGDTDFVDAQLAAQLLPEIQRPDS